MAVRTRWTGGRALPGEARTAWRWEDGEARAARRRRRRAQGGSALVRARDAARTAVLALDHIAFGADGFDTAALDAALHATTAVRLRAVGRGSMPQGYAITGAAGRRGYVQRLAVHPDARRRGIGGALLVDGLRWA